MNTNVYVCTFDLYHLQKMKPPHNLLILFPHILAIHSFTIQLLETHFFIPQTSKTGGHITNSFTGILTLI